MLNAMQPKLLPLAMNFILEAQTQMFFFSSYLQKH